MRDAPGRRGRWPNVAGRVAFEGLTYRFPGADQGVFDLDFEAEPGRHRGPGRPHRLGQDHHAGAAAAPARPRRRPHPDRRHDIRDVTLTSLRHAMAVVFQEAGLFNRSIPENLRVGKPDATDAEIEAAARPPRRTSSSCASPAATTSSSASAASIAVRRRAPAPRHRPRLLKDAPILLLDEATSALDTETEARIKQALDAAAAGPHHLRHRAPPVDHRRRRPDRGARRRPDRRARPLPRARRRRRPVRPPGGGRQLHRAGGLRWCELPPDPFGQRAAGKVAIWLELKLFYCC